MIVTFLPDNIRCEIKTGETVMDAASKCGIHTGGVCAGKGICGKCKVRVGKNIELACSYRPVSDITVELIAQDDYDPGLSIEEDFIKTGNVSPQEGYGIAFDIGTTTVAAVLWDMKNLRASGSTSVLNPQRIHGADVISRLSFVQSVPGGLTTLRREITECMNEMIAKLAAEAAIERSEIKKCTVCGNMTMSHIIAGEDPSSLATAPFTPVFKEARYLDPSETGLCLDEAIVYLLPGIAGQVGSDITADMMALKMTGNEAASLLVDIGTNGEMVLASDGQLWTCSVAAGPALEGGSLSCGMRAAEGAVDVVKVRGDELVCHTIGEKEPRGICGSGIIDAVSCMLDIGALAKDGLITGGDRFRISENVEITQKDIREVQLAKGAIRAGIDMLLEKAGLAAEDLEKLVVTGSFGNKIDIGGAMKIGLLPDIAEEKVSLMPDGAASGASIVLLSEEARRTAEDMVRKVRHVELAGNEAFSERFIASLNF